MLPLKVIGVYSSYQDNQTVRHFVRLYECRHRQEMYLQVGQSEALSTAVALGSGGFGRPKKHRLAHDLIVSLLDATGAVLEKVCISDVKGKTFYALAFVRDGETVHEIDLRPSDALALALRALCPIYIAESVLAAAGRPCCDRTVPEHRSRAV